MEAETAKEILERIRRKNRERLRRWKKRHPDKVREYVRKHDEQRKKTLHNLRIAKEEINKREKINLRNCLEVSAFLYLYYLATRCKDEEAKQRLEKEFSSRI